MANQPPMELSGMTYRTLIHLIIIILTIHQHSNALWNIYSLFKRFKQVLQAADCQAALIDQKSCCRTVHLTTQRWT